MTPATNSAHVLIVDDEPDIRELLEEFLSSQNLTTQTAADAAQARQLIAEAAPRIVILDIQMPGEDGLSLARWIREHHPGCGIIMLTTAAEAIDRVVGLEIGADDYVPKPFDLRELLARIRALLRRLADTASSAANATNANNSAGPPKSLIPFGSCTLDLEAHRLLDADNQEVPITAAEFDLLSLFARNPNKPLNRDQIMERAHNKGWEVFDRSIDLRIMRLRRKIEINPNKPEVLKTVRGVGYIFATGATTG
ncbi:MAG: response regulator [Burkholderiaceae bacterium]